VAVHSQALASLLKSCKAGDDSSSSTQQLEGQLQLLQQDVTGLSKDAMQQALAGKRTHRAQMWQLKQTNPCSLRSHGKAREDSY
jgi:hypothetical protein